MLLQDLNLDILFSRPLVAKLSFAPGFSQEIMELWKSFLADLWIPPKFESKYPTRATTTGSALIWENASFYNVLELMSRALFLEDISIQDPKDKEWISLTGQPLYKRGFREVLSASAPLREDVAQILLQSFGKQTHSRLVVPFSGTGTFGWEWYCYQMGFLPILFSRGFEVTKLPKFKNKTWEFFVKRALEEVQFPETEVFLIDFHEPAIQNSLANEKNWKQELEKRGFQAKSNEAFTTHTLQMDFLNFHPKSTQSNFQKNKSPVFMPIHPPYGLRQKSAVPTDILYSKIGEWVSDWADFCQDNQIPLSGFILCPEQKSWSRFLSKIQSKKHKTELKFSTRHFTQGGIDIRVVNFGL